MADELETVEEVVEVVETPEIDTPAGDETQYSEVEKRAMAQGWKPKDQFDGDESDFVSAAEFERRGQLFKKIADVNRKYERVTGALSALQKHHKAVYESSYKKAMEDLKAQHRAAVEEGNVAKADDIIDQIQVKNIEAAQQMQQLNAAPVEQGVPAAMEEFNERNAHWYQKDDVMTAYADRVGHEFTRSQLAGGRRPTVEQILGHVESQVRNKFPSAFGGKRAAPSPVASASSPSRPGNRSTFGEKDLSPEEVSVMKTLARDGVMTEKQYIDEIKKMRGVK